MPSVKRTKVRPFSPISDAGPETEKVGVLAPPSRTPSIRHQMTSGDWGTSDVRNRPHLAARREHLKENKLLRVSERQDFDKKFTIAHQKKRWQKVSDGWNNFKYTMEPWGGFLRTVEGYHGSAVVSYFVFLRYLLLVNVVMFVLTMFIWLPQALLDSADPEPGSLADNCSAAYQVNVTSDPLTLVLDFFQGTGWMEKTAVFYGYYSGHGLKNAQYNLSLAYFLVCISCLLVTVILMGMHMASSFRQSMMSDSDSSEFSCKVFSAWDYTLSNKRSAAIKRAAIRYEIRSDLNEMNFLKRREARMQDGCKKCSLYTWRFLINVVILVVLGCCGYLIYFVTDFSTGYVSQNSQDTGTEKVLLLLLIQYLPSITITLLNAIVPLLFQKVVQGESYTAAFVINITLVRTVFLRLASLTVLIATLYKSVTCKSKDECRNTTKPLCDVITCWETHVGQQLYKLIIMDLLVVLLKTLLVELPWRLVYDKCHCGLMKTVGAPEFDIPSNVLDAVYSQCLYWLSLTFAPLTPGFAVIKTLVTFYLKLLSALKACPPTEHPYRASRSNTFFIFILLLAFFLCSVPVGYTLFNMEPSHGCGPFRSYNLMHQALSHTVDNWPSAARDVYDLLFSPAIIGPLIIFLCLVIYYMSVLASAHKSMSEMFQEQLILESREKHLAKVRGMGGQMRSGTQLTRRLPSINTLDHVDENSTPLRRQDTHPY